MELIRDTPATRQDKWLKYGSGRIPFKTGKDNQLLSSDPIIWVDDQLSTCKVQVYCYIPFQWPMYSELLGSVERTSGTWIFSNRESQGHLYMYII